MRYLRMFSNAVIAGVAGAAYLSVLVLQLNPRVPLFPTELGPLVVTLMLSYGLNLAVLFYALIVLRQLVAAKVVSPGWISLRLLSWLFTGAAAGAAALMWLNLRAFGPMLDPETVRRMAAGAGALTGCALVFLAIALVHYSFGRPASLIGASLLSLTALASLALPITARGPGVQAPLESRALAVDVGFSVATSGPRVVMILLDGASLDFISAAAVEGRLPNFGKILDGGAAMHLATLRPVQPNPVWTSVATGKLPFKTGIRSTARYRVWLAEESLELLPDFCFSQGLVRFGFVTEQRLTSAAVRARPLWSILSGLGISVGVVGWPLTHPAQPVRGYLVTDEFHKQDTLSADPDDPSAVYPAELLNTARLAAASRAGADMEQPADEVAPAAPTLTPQIAAGQVLAADRLYERVDRALEASSPVRVAAVRYRLLDEAGHYYLRYAMPWAFGDVTDEERRRYGNVLESCYAVVDAVVGRAIASLEPGSLLLVVSGFGMEPQSMEKRLLQRAIGDRELSGTHEGAPDGFMLAYGTTVAAGRRTRASVVDVTPTVLYFLGLPVARDMDGFARADLFKPEFTETHPVTFIPTYER
jgi:predicted AlkP superfamily phosphohydrolase/phosphomutase